MSDETSENLPDEVLLALAYSDAANRDALRIFFEFDARLARIVSATTEPMLGQMRLAWWREMLSKPSQEWPEGDQVLDGIKDNWKGRANLLVPLVDAWEQMLAEPPFEKRHAIAISEGRQGALLAAFNLADDHNSYRAGLNAAQNWVLADLASKVSIAEEREMLLEIASGSISSPGRLPRAMRGLAVLGALGRRALKRGGRPLMEGRGASLVAIRAAITGK